jgi:ribosomal protein L29
VSEAVVGGTINLSNKKEVSDFRKSIPQVNTVYAVLILTGHN